MPDEHQTKQFIESLSDEEVKDLVMDFRLSSVGARITKELKEEYRAAERYCAKRRKDNFLNRDFKGTSTMVQGTSKDKSTGVMRQERMKLPTLVDIEIEKRFGKQWRNDKSAWKWAWDKYPQFRLVEK